MGPIICRTPSGSTRHTGDDSLIFAPIIILLDSSPEDEKIFEDACKACNERGAFLLGGIDSMDKEDLKTAMKRCCAFVVDGTGLGSSPNSLQKIKGIIRKFPLIISGGISPETLKERLVIADGAILNAEFREHGKENSEVNLTVLEDYMSRMKSLRSALFLLRKMS